MIEIIKPTWDVDPRVHALCTTRIGGHSTGPYRGLNLATHVGDDLGAVITNRQLLRAQLALPREPCWLRQTHGTDLVADEHAHDEPQADACYATTAGTVCAVMTADCLPILLCDRAATTVVAIHAGWRGIYNGIIGKTLAKLASPARRWCAWIGPGISATAYRVGVDLKNRFFSLDPAHAAFFKYRDLHWHADLAGIAQYQLEIYGVDFIERYGGCTAGEPARFYSFRRDGVCGRMASLIWLA
ncbi:MAG: peptidoglycan editing factor PgeF [Gammaproteobacteria bacterium]|nr:peptidoglycan editing factor PgeF [Gammaproteobacteria bacterium]